MPFDDVNDGPPFPTGPIKIECLSIEDAESKFDHSPQMRWSFRVWDQNGVEMLDNGVSATWLQWTSRKLSPGSRAHLWAQALLGRTLTVGESGAALQQSLIGKTANAFAEVYIRNAGTPDERKGSKLSAISPIAQAAPEPVTGSAGFRPGPDPATGAEGFTLGSGGLGDEAAVPF